MEIQTYETIIETLSEALSMEKWKREQAEKKALALERDYAIARKALEDLTKKGEAPYDTY